MMIRLREERRHDPHHAGLHPILAAFQWQPAEKLSVSEGTIRRWKGRDSVEDRPHTAHRLRTTLTPAQELIVVELRRVLLLPLDDLRIVREFIHPKVSRSALARCLRRHGVGSLKVLQPVAEKPAHKPIEAYVSGCPRMDVKYLPQMPNEERHRYLFVAIDRATRWVYVEIKSHKTAAAAQAFLAAVHKACPHHQAPDGQRQGVYRPSVWHKGPTDEFDQLCEAQGFEHRATDRVRHKPTAWWSASMAESQRF